MSKALAQSGGEQPAITKSDDKRIKQRAVTMLTAFQELLNFIAENELPSDDLDNVIRSSYADPSRRKFFDSTAVLVQDLEDRTPNAPPSEDVVRGYLTDFNIFYVKQSNPSIEFSNYQVSNIKKGDHLYLEILYDCKFTSKSRRMDNVPLQHKVAFFRVVHEGTSWKTYIENVDFYTPADSAKFNQGDIPIAPDPSDNATTTSAATTGTDTASTAGTDSTLQVKTVLTQEERDRIRKENEALAARKLTDNGDSALNRKDYFTALKDFTYAQKIDDANPYLKARIQNVNQLIDQQNITPEKQYDIYIQQATLAKGQHHYDEARVAYDKALGVKPAESDKLRPLINELTAKALLLNRINLKMDDHDNKGALEAAKAAVTQYPGDPVFLLKRATAYENQGDNKQARKDYAKAVDLEPGYLEAYLIRGAYYERIKDYTSALSDYTVVAQTDRNNDSVYLLTAALQVDKGDITRAIGELDKGIAVNPARFIFYQQKGELEYDHQHQPAQAMADFSTAILKDPTIARAWYYRGLCEVDLDKVDEASHDFAQARDLHLGKPELDHVAGLAVIYYGKGMDAYRSKTEDALRFFNDAVLVDPSRDCFRLARGDYFFYLKNDYAASADNYSQAIFLNKHNDTAYQQRGRAEYNMAQYAPAVADLDTAISLNGQVPERYLYRGYGSFKLGQYDKAIHDMDQVPSWARAAKRELPDTIQAAVFDVRGECYFQQGNYAVALDNFKNAVKFNKGFKPSIVFDRGKTFLKLNQLKDAQVDVSAAVSQQPGNARWEFTLGEIYRLSGNYQEAASRYTEALKKDTSAEVLYERAVCRIKLASYDGALSDLQQLRAQGQDVQYPDYQGKVGGVYIKMGRTDSAAAAFQGILAKDQGDADALYGMGEVSMQKGQKDEALAWFGKAFATGRIHRSAVKEDRTLDPIRDDKAFRSLLKKYSDQMPK
jgi:tetratricopeptide (TPR) repeat protein